MGNLKVNRENILNLIQNHKIREKVAVQFRGHQDQYRTNHL